MGAEVSIIIPVYNTDKFIIDCLDSVCNQSLKEIEIICVNDGSTDRSLMLLYEYVKHDSRIHIISQENLGVGSARNAGVAIATGKYIQFIDSDDMLGTDALSYEIQQMIEKQLDVFYFDAHATFESAQLEKDKSNYKTYYHRENHYQDVQTGYQLFTKWIKDGGFRPNGNLQIIRRDFLLRSGVKYIPGIVQEDNAFTAELMLHARRVCHVNKPLYIRRVRPDSIMTKPQAFINAYGYFRCALVMEEYFFNPCFQDNTRSALKIFSQSLLRSMETIYRNIPDEERIKIKEIPKEERGPMLYFCWYNEQNVKIMAEYRKLQKENANLVINLKNEKENKQTVQKILANMEKQYEEANADKRKLQNQIFILRQEIEEIRHKSTVYQQQLTDKNKILIVLQADFAAMQHSLSFQVGRKLTWLPRKIRDIFYR